MGNLKNCEVKLEIDPTVSPVAQNSRQLPHSMRKKVNEKLYEMEEQGIIEKVKGVTPWLSPLIPILKKGGDLRLVLDMRVPNQALKRRRVQFPHRRRHLTQNGGCNNFHRTPTRVVVDASPWAVGAVLLQQQSDCTYRPIAFGSRSLTGAEMKYSQIEKEALAIVFGCEHFHLYLYGKSFEMETDTAHLSTYSSPNQPKNERQHE
ncbi:Hypothetical predicted protein [Paramuricea clavata]|uniref:Reverse transcriptase RNase H-like domain-containing protein n=1 Tax=Paramuricea clavata TaxID=317549 RepID=A0A7D9IEH9_PARCT|nr:Hypothetical predicted protein [Paramuricea clavata]